MTADRPLPVDRRTVLLVGASALLAAAAGCAKEQPDPKAVQLLASLREQSRRAWQESEQAELLVGHESDHAKALREACDLRRAHAETLDAQIARLDPPKTTTSTTATSSSPKPPAPASLDEFKASLAESQRLAGELAKGSSGYLAGLAASVAAATRALLVVALAEEAQ
ncbi:MAG: hypothetical protein ACRC20_08790 [Segniliparus sp.]|uniref:hypothetical protein n=1 Tax=Segniliparus sp. TaxID=2804064 RepID=UPI003F2C6491